MTLKGTKTGVMTDADGSYRIEVPSTAKTLVFSYVGFETWEQTISSQNSISVQLKPGQSNLDEVVVVAYGNVKR